MRDNPGLQLYPVPMARFGLNPFGENLFRIVLAQTRKALGESDMAAALEGRMTGRSKMTWQPIYMHKGWTLEMWQDGFTITGCTQAQWKRDGAQYLGPYPDRGDYRMVGNSSFDPAQTNIEKLIQLIVAGSNFSWAERLKACRVNAEYAENTAKKLREDIINDAQSFRGTEALVGFGGHRGTKTAPVLRSANELRLPRPTGMQINGGPRMMTAAQGRRFGFQHRKMDVSPLIEQAIA